MNEYTLGLCGGYGRNPLDDEPEPDEVDEPDYEDDYDYDEEDDNFGDDNEA